MGNTDAEEGNHMKAFVITLIVLIAIFALAAAGSMILFIIIYAASLVVVGILMERL